MGKRRGSAPGLHTSLAGAGPAPRVRVAAVVSGWVVAAAVAAVWIVLSLWAHLIFHLMPAAPSLGAALTFGWRTGAGLANPKAPAQPAELVALLAGALVVTAATALVLTRVGHFLDRPLVVAAIALAGAVLGGLALRGRWLRPG